MVCPPWTMVNVCQWQLDTQHSKAQRLATSRSPKCWSFNKWLGWKFGLKWCWADLSFPTDPMKSLCRQSQPHVDPADCAFCVISALNVRSGLRHWSWNQKWHHWGPNPEGEGWDYGSDLVLISHQPFHIPPILLIDHSDDKVWVVQICTKPLPNPEGAGKMRWENISCFWHSG